MLEESLRKGNDSEVMEGLSHIREGVQESYDDVRELLVHFRTRVHQSDLEGAIRGTLEKFEGQTGIKATLKISWRGRAARSQQRNPGAAYRAGSPVQCQKTCGGQHSDGGSLASWRLRHFGARQWPWLQLRVAARRFPRRHQYHEGKGSPHWWIARNSFQTGRRYRNPPDPEQIIA